MFVLNLARPFNASGSTASAIILSSCCLKNMKDGETATIDAMRPIECPVFSPQTQCKVRPLGWSLTSTSSCWSLCPTNCPLGFLLFGEEVPVFFCLLGCCCFFFAVSSLCGHTTQTNLTLWNIPLSWFHLRLEALLHVSPTYCIQQTQHKLLLLFATSLPSRGFAVAVSLRRKTGV